MAKGDVHTVPHNDGWANRVEGNSRVSNTASTKAEAQRKGRDMARWSSPGSVDTGVLGGDGRR